VSLLFRCRLQNIKKKLALRQFPTLFLYPAGLSTPLYFHLDYWPNATSVYYIDIIEKYLLRTSDVLSDVSSVHDKVMEACKIMVRRLLCVCVCCRCEPPCARRRCLSACVPPSISP
jgi:hypothetical protein